VDEQAVRYNSRIWLIEVAPKRESWNNKYLKHLVGEMGSILIWLIYAIGSVRA